MPMGTKFVISNLAGVFVSRYATSTVHQDHSAGDPFKQKSCRGYNLDMEYLVFKAIFTEEARGEFFWIDNDGFEACPIEVSVLKDAVNSFPLSDI
ncbi:hypothetical protein ACTXT7_000993 [Hymenolepis weldensis]